MQIHLFILLWTAVHSLAFFSLALAFTALIFYFLLKKEKKALREEILKNASPLTEEIIEEKSFAKSEPYKRKPPIAYEESSADDVLVLCLKREQYQKGTMEIFRTEEEKEKYSRALGWSSRDFMDSVGIQLTQMYNSNPMFRKFLQFVAGTSHDSDPDSWSITLETGTVDVAPDEIYSDWFKTMGWWLRLNCWIDILNPEKLPILSLRIQNLGSVNTDGSAEQSCDVWMPPAYIPTPDRLKVLDALFKLQKTDTAIPYLLSLEKFKTKAAELANKKKPIEESLSGKTKVA